MSDIARPGPMPTSLTRLTTRASWVQRLVESMIALPILILSLPVMLVIAVLIRIDSKGNPLFFQRRLGAGARPFWFVKFRTLHADARTRFPELYAYKYTDEELKDFKFKIVNDPRVTRMGAWLRKSTLDELPNFWNVLTGDMALVGPRPEIPEMLPYYQGEMLEKFSVRPGVTGMAQISGRGRLSFFETVDLDVQYVRSRCLLLDIRIMIMTLYKIVVRDGAF